MKELARRAGVRGATIDNPLGELGISITWRAAAGPDVRLGPDGLEVLVAISGAGPAELDALLAARPGAVETIAVADLLPPGHPRQSSVDSHAGSFGRALGDREDGLPVPLRREGRAVFTLNESGCLEVGFDLVTFALVSLTRWEEQVSATRDAHGRFPGTASLAERLGFLDRPLVDELAQLLSYWLRILRPGWTPAVAKFSVALSHDIDQIRPFASTSMAIRSVLGDVVRRRSARRALATLGLFPSQARASRIGSSPAFAGIHRLSDVDRRRHGRAASHFYMMVDPDEPLGPDYDLLAKHMQITVAQLVDLGHRIGLHGGYTTLGDRRRLIAQAERLREALSSADRAPASLGGRQHFLRFRAPDTWRDYVSAGLDHEASLGFADREGFRAGTAHSFRPFDFDADAELPVEARPLIAMDVTLRDYRGYAPAEAVERVVELAEKCLRVGGTFSLLWHNTSLQREWAAWGPAYAATLARLARLTRLARPAKADAPSA